MKIAVVAYEMEGSKTGVGRYLEGLLSGVTRCDVDWQWKLYFKGEPFSHPLWSATRKSQAGPRFEARFDRRPQARPIPWEQLRLPRLLRRDRPDVVFSPAYSLPPATGGAPGLVTVHDLSFELLGHEFPRRERWRRRLLARRAVKRARRVLTDTEEIARDLMRVYGVAYEKIGVVPLGLDSKFFDKSVGEDGPTAADDGPRAEDADLEPYGIRRPYLLHLGSILERRHLDLLIGAFAAIASDWPDLSLVIAGRNRLRQRERLERWIQDSGVADRIQHVGYVREEDLALLYRRATLSYYLSSYEGYGLPPLESLAAGTPPIVGRGLALDELWEDYPYRVLTLDRSAITRMTRKALDDAAGRRRIAREGVGRMAQLDWTRAAELFLEEIRRL